MLLLSSLAVAWARDPSCPELYASNFSALLEEADLAFAEMDIDGATQRLVGAESRLPCVVDVVPTEDMARYALRRAWVAALDVDQGEVDRWLGLARALDPSLPFPSYVPMTHPIRDAAAQLVDRVPTELEGSGLVVPNGGGVFLDGRFLTKPVAEPGLPHLLQVGDGSGFLVVSQWQDGMAFPPDLLGPPLAEDPTMPDWFGQPIDPRRGGRAPKPARPSRPWTEARMANLERGAGFAAVGGTLFLSALLARGAYDQRPSDGLFLLTDGATIGSAVSGGAALVLTGVAVFGK